MYQRILIIALFFIAQATMAQIQKDSLSIVNLLEKELRTWRSGDLEGHAQCWQVKPYTKIWVNYGDGNTLDVPPELITQPSSEMIGQGGLAFLSNLKMNVFGSNAWVNYDEVSVDAAGKETYSNEFRILEKIEERWKIVGQYLNFYTPPQKKKDTTSYVNIVDINTKAIQNILTTDAHYEAPNWHPDNYLILNSYGKLKTLDLATKKVGEINTGTVTALNNDHGLSPDNKLLVLSNFDKTGRRLSEMISSLYIVPVTGGQPKKISNDSICFWHGWSPDGATLAYVGMKGENLDVYTIPVTGGPAKRITTTAGLDDGPEYSPDGKYIYFNSYRSGHMQIWRMQPDGSQPEQLTFDSYSNWFPHISPDNQWMVYISYVTDQKQDHLFGKKVKLRLMHLATKEISDLTPVFYGGQGTINVPSWSPDSKKVAFVSYAVSQ